MPLNKSTYIKTNWLKTLVRVTRTIEVARPITIQKNSEDAEKNIVSNAPFKRNGRISFIMAIEKYFSNRSANPCIFKNDYFYYLFFSSLFLSKPLIKNLIIGSVILYALQSFVNSFTKFWGIFSKCYSKLFISYYTKTNF